MALYRILNQSDCVGKLDAPPIQHPHVLRWFNQVKHEMGAKEPKAVAAASSNAAAPTAPAASSASGHSKLVDPTMLPKRDMQRDAKTGQMKASF